MDHLTDHPDCPSAVTALIDEARSLLAKARALEAFLNGRDCVVKLLRAEVDAGSAAGTLGVSLRAEPSELSLILLAALRAGNLDLLVIEQHLFSLVGVAATSGTDPVRARKGSGGQTAGAA